MVATAPNRAVERTARPSRVLRAGIVGVAATAALALGTPAISSAEPVVPPNSMTLPDIPYDAELAAAVRMLKDAGVDRMALEAAQAVVGSAGQLSATDIIDRLNQLSGLLPTQQAAESGSFVPAASTDPTALLKQLGIQTLTPSVAPFCTDATADNPLGLVTAGAGAAPGPWPLKSGEPKLPFPLPFITLPKLNIVDAGETAYAFVPASGTAGTGGKMQVAWFNPTTLKGGFADLEPIAKNSPALGVLPLLSGVRLAPVKTGTGTILSAVFGTAQNGARTCTFLPAVGIVNA
ncbi:hypothetical protein AAFP30_01945 [Gordonia sp. CPCC 205515]|uniref:hypothetical protein n=1 Tax=Gordonia sp. CPCC 205515 TaxID=3140791 RepID=UPI003AF37798